MARIWQEGFEHGVPNPEYQVNGFSYVWERDSSLSDSEVGRYYRIFEGRPPYSNFSLGIGGSLFTIGFTKNLGVYNEIYVRAYIKPSGQSATTGDTVLMLRQSSTFNHDILRIVTPTNSTTGKIRLQVRLGGTLTTIGDYDFQYNTWAKVDIYLKMGTSDGAYALKLDNVEVASDSSVNTGTLSISQLYLGSPTTQWTYFDDIAVNDTTGTINNSWCGDGQIVGLKPKANGTYTGWTPEGYTLAEADTNTTTLKITAHGLASDDVIYNVTRDAYRIVTKSDDNTLTMTDITGQTAEDTIVAFDYVSTITAGTGTTTSLVNITGHTLDSYDVFVNTTRSNAVRRVLYIDGSLVYNSATNLTNNTGSTITSQASGDSIKTFKVHFYPLTNWKTCANERPNPQLARITTTTPDAVNTFDMQELTTDKAIPNTWQVRAVSVDYYAGDIGTGGSEFKPVLKSGVSEDVGDAIALPTVARKIPVIYDESPFTSSQWTRNEVDGLEAGVKAV